MTETMLTFRVIGDPKAQGSKRAMVGKSGKAFVVEQNSNDHARWRNAVTEAAVQELNGRRPLDGPLGLYIEFRQRMPKSRPSADRARGWMWRTTAPDTDKLIRAVGDALQAAGAMGDDAQFCVVHATKIEVLEGWIGASIEISREDYEVVADG